MAVCRLFLAVLFVAALCGCLGHEATVAVAPHDPLALQRCVMLSTAPPPNVTSVRCLLQPGRHTTGVQLAPTGPVRVPLTIAGDDTDTWSGAGRFNTTTLFPPSLTSLVAVPGVWEQHRGSIWKVGLKLPPGFAPEQLFFEHQTWMPEARWPNVNLTAGARADAPGGPLDINSWAKTSTDTRLQAGMIVDPALAQGTPAAVNWTGALATLNVGYRFLSWTREVLSAHGDRFFYHYTCHSTTNVGGRGHYVTGDNGDNLYFLSGKLEALDAPGEWFYDNTSSTLYAWAPDSGNPTHRIQYRSQAYCLDLPADGAPINLHNVSFLGCTFALRNCVGCHVADLNLTYPAYARRILNRDVTTGPRPPTTLLQGNDSVVERVAVRYSNIGGLQVVGSRNIVRDSLFEDLGWTASLDHSPIQLGFAYTGLPFVHNPNSEEAAQQPQARPLSPPSSSPPLVGGQTGPAFGNDNKVLEVTVRRFGELGILTSQLSNEIGYAHVYDGGLIGLDHACVHADNTPVTCMNISLPPEERANCTKVWHHLWVHNCREKCVRGDDQNRNLTLHHSVVFNCGKPLADRNAQASAGFLVKGDGNRYFQNTIYGVVGTNGSEAQGDLCVSTLVLPNVGGQENRNSLFLNSANENITTHRGAPIANCSFALFSHLYRGHDLGLRDPVNFDFRPRPDSPLVRAGMVHPPEAPARPDGHPPDIGAYQHDDADPWRPGCMFLPACQEILSK